MHTCTCTCTHTSHVCENKDVFFTLIILLYSTQTEEKQDVSFKVKQIKIVLTWFLSLYIFLTSLIWEYRVEKFMFALHKEKPDKWLKMQTLTRHCSLVAPGCMDVVRSSVLAGMDTRDASSPQTAC